MNKTTAIKASIKKWDLIAQGVHSQNEGTCALCDLYQMPTCRLCPIFEKTGKTQCQGTPYKDTNLDSSLTLKEDLYTNPDNPPNLDAVEEEIEFLISLLPDKEKEAYRLWIKLR